MMIGKLLRRTAGGGIVREAQTGSEGGSRKTRRQKVGRSRQKTLQGQLLAVHRQESELLQLSLFRRDHGADELFSGKTE
jgi:hypothetical protein